jgi:hypothetical protein
MTSLVTTLLLLAGLFVGASLGEDGDDVFVNTAQDGLTASLDIEHTGEAEISAAPAGVSPVADLGTEVQGEFCAGINYTPSCDPATAAAEPQPQGVVTNEMIASAFRRIPLPPSKLIVQPPNGRTLVNFATNFYTETGPFTRAVTLLGQRVELDITPAAYMWNFGDGGSTSTSSPGAAYPDLEVTHTYLRKGRVSPRVDTTYTATYRVNGGPAQPVPGSVTIAGGPVPLQVVTASPQLVG